MPTTTAGTQLTQPDLLPILNVLLPSILGTIDKNTHRFRYTLYVGFDIGDQMYDIDQKQRRLQKRMTTMVGDYPLVVELVRFNVSLSSTYVWNGLFELAMREGDADYFLTAHDDTEFYPSQGSYWSDVMTRSLRENILAKNFGVAAPLDMRDPKGRAHNLLTHSYDQLKADSAEVCACLKLVVTVKKSAFIPVKASRLSLDITRMCL